MDVHIGRQAIVDCSKNIVAYELLFRAAADSAGSDRNDVMATATVLRGGFFDVGIDRLLEGVRGLVNVPGELLVHPSLRMLPPESIAIEILETVVVTPEILRACRELKEAGFRLVLDDYIGQPELEPLIEFADCIKIDFRAIGTEDLKKLTKSLNARGKVMLAEKIETEAEFRLALKLGCKFFQGYFLHRPKNILGRHVPTRHLSLIRILSMLSTTDDLSLQQIEKVIAQDVGLTVKLLRFANTAMNFGTGSVDSLAQCFLKLGTLEVRRFIAIVSLPQLGASSSAQLMERAVVRGRMSEGLAAYAGREDIRSRAFLVGMFSLLDEIMSVPMAQILQELQLTPEMHEALMTPDTSESLLGRLVALVRDYENADLARLRQMSKLLGITPEQLAQAYVEAVHWATTQTRNMNGGTPLTSPDIWLGP